jgi:hypothetical protein
MKTQRVLVPCLSMAACSISASVQSVRLTFDNDQSDYGAFQATGAETELTLSRAGGTIAANDFAELDGLTSETYSISGESLAPHTPVGFSITTTGGSAKIDGTSLDVGGGGIDSGESITFVFDRSIVISEFDFVDIGAAEVAYVTIAGSTHTFGDSDGDAHSGHFILNQGQALEFALMEANGADYDLQGFTFAVVPEPQTYAVFAGSCALAWAMLRRRKWVHRRP